MRAVGLGDLGDVLSDLPGALQYPGLEVKRDSALEIGSAVAAVVLQRLGGTARLPDRMDITAERVFVGMHIDPDRDPRWTLQTLRVISPSDFADPFLRDARVALEGVMSRTPAANLIAAVALTLKAGGFPITAEGAAEELLTAVQESRYGEVPQCSSGFRISEAARCRRMSLWLRRLDEDICLGRVNTERAIEKMKKATDA